MRTGFKLLEGVTSTGAGAAVDTSTFDRFTFFIEGTGITSGGTMKIQTRTLTGAWVDVDSRNVTSAVPNYTVIVNGPLDAVRANLSARTDGTYSVSVTVGRDR